VETLLNTFEELRQRYHMKLQQTIWHLTPPPENSKLKTPVPSNADHHSKVSVEIASGMLENTQAIVKRADGQTSGKIFTDITLDFLREAFLLLEHLRPGPWRFSSSQASVGIAAFYQYEHLALLEDLLEKLEHDSSADKKDLRAMFAGNYLIKPDIIIARKPVNDALINAKQSIISPEQDIALHTPLRETNNQTELLHASISCKWTFRSDRAQNARTEALNLIRDRKGHTPHIVVVTGEPLPSRLASLAMGTGDIDCVYHMALFEMVNSISKYGDETAQDLFDTLVRGRRLRDISDLPFDLAI
jgi:hypothetical protein